MIFLGLLLTGLLVAWLLGAFKGGRRPDAEAPEPLPLPQRPGNEAWMGMGMGMGTANAKAVPVADPPAANPSASADEFPRGDGPREGSIPLGGLLIARFAVRTHQGSIDGITTHRAVVLPPAGVFYVTDGFGPHGPGLTNAVAADEIRISLAASYRGPPRPAGDTLASAISAANEELFTFIRDHREFAGSGATVAAVALSPGGSAAAHVGAERVYRARRGRLEQLTEDHSIINDFIRMKSITDEEEKRKLRREGPHRNVIVRALGMKDSVNVEVTGLEIQAGDRLLLATKHLGDALLEDDLSALLTAPGPAEALCDSVLREAVKAAPHQNHAAIVIAIEAAS
jgi:protein phosphatase